MNKDLKAFRLINISKMIDRFGKKPMLVEIGKVFHKSYNGRCTEDEVQAGLLSIIAKYNASSKTLIHYILDNKLMSKHRYEWGGFIYPCDVICEVNMIREGLNNVRHGGRKLPRGLYKGLKHFKETLTEGDIEELTPSEQRALVKECFTIDDRLWEASKKIK